MNRFYAVTKTSVYKIEGRRNEESGEADVQKIALRGESRVGVGERLRNGDFVGIMKMGIVLYRENNPQSGGMIQPPEAVPFWGGHTSPIIGLFLRLEEAITCHNSPEKRTCDPRWRKQTEETLQEIGENHPVLRVSVSNPPV